MYTSSGALQLVTLEVQDHLARWFGDEASLAGSPPSVRMHKRSFMVRYAVRQAPCPGVLIKIPRPPAAQTLDDALRLQLPRPSTRKEFDNLASCHELFSRADPAHLCAVRPLSYWPAWNAIAMEELPGVSLANHRLRFPLSGAYPRFPELLRRAGMWLRVFHREMGQVQTETISADSLSQQWNDGREMLYEYIKPDSFVKWNEAFHWRLEDFGEPRLPVVNLHGDFKLGNLLVSSTGQIAAIDTKMRNRGAIYADVAKLVSDLVSDNVSALSLGIFSPSAACKAAFLRGYFGSSSWDEDALDLFSALSILHKWAWEEKMISRRGKSMRLVRPLLRQYLRFVLDRTLSVDNIRNAQVHGRIR